MPVRHRIVRSTRLANYVAQFVRKHYHNNKQINSNDYFLFFAAFTNSNISKTPFHKVAFCVVSNASVFSFVVEGHACQLSRRKIKRGVFVNAARVIHNGYLNR